MASSTGEAALEPFGGVGVWDAAVEDGVGVPERLEGWEPSGSTVLFEAGVRQACSFDGGVCQTIVHEALSLLGLEVYWVLELGFFRDVEFGLRVSGEQAYRGFCSRPREQKWPEGQPDSSPGSREHSVFQQASPDSCPTGNRIGQEQQRPKNPHFGSTLHNITCDEFSL